MPNPVTSHLTYKFELITLLQKHNCESHEIEDSLLSHEKEIIIDFMDKSNNIMQGNNIYRLPCNLVDNRVAEILLLYTNFNQQTINFDNLTTLHQSLVSLDNNQYLIEQLLIYIYNNESLQSPKKNFSFVLASCLYLITGKKHVYEIMFSSFLAKRHCFKYDDFLKCLKHFLKMLVNYYQIYLNVDLQSINLKKNTYYLFMTQIAFNSLNIKTQLKLYACYKFLNRQDKALLFEMFDNKNIGLKFGQYSVSERFKIKTYIMDFFSLVFKSCSNDLGEYGFPSLENSFLSFKFRNNPEFANLRKLAFPYTRLASLRKLDFSNINVDHKPSSNKRNAAEAKLDSQLRQSKTLRLSVPETKLTQFSATNFNCAEIFLEAANKLANPNYKLKVD